MTDARKARKTILRTTNSLFLLVLLCSCGGACFHSFRSIDGGWHRDSAVVYMYDGHHRGSCAMSVETRTTAAYRFKNVVVRAEYLNVCDSLLGSDTISIPVFSDKGRRLGATAGMLYQHSSRMGHVDFPKGDSVVIRISHIMSDEILHGVTDVGIKLVDLD